MLFILYWCMCTGSGIGTIQLVNTYSGQVENEFKLFMCPVRGLEWIDCSSILMYSYPDPPSYGNRAVKSDIAILKVKSGQTLIYLLPLLVMIHTCFTMGDACHKRSDCG